MDKVYEYQYRKCKFLDTCKQKLTTDCPLYDPMWKEDCAYGDRCYECDCCHRSHHEFNYRFYIKGESR